MSVGGWWDNRVPDVPYAWWGGIIPPWQGNPYYWGDYFPPPPPTVDREVCPCCGAILSAPMTYTSDSTA